MSEIELLSQLKTQLVAFLDELIETFPNESDFIIMRIFIRDQLPIQDVMEYIVSKLCPLAEMVKTRNEDFFLTQNVLFDSFDREKKDKINHFKRLWTSGVLDKGEKEDIWRWFSVFIYLGNKYRELRTRST